MSNAVTDEMVEAAAKVLNERLAKHDGLFGVSRDMLSAALSLPPQEAEKIDRKRAADAAVTANHAFGQWMPERWLHLFLDAYEGKKMITLNDVQRGYDAWAAKPHNAKWVRKIDGTPIANDIIVNIFEALKDTPQEADPAVVLTGGEDALDVLSSLASYLGVGLGDETTTAEQFDKRIRWGIDNHTNGTIRLCGAVVERLSQEPYTTWGDIKKAILDLIQDTTLDGLPSDIPSPSKDLQQTEGEAE